MEPVFWLENLVPRAEPCRWKLLLLPVSDSLGFWPGGFLVFRAGMYLWSPGWPWGLRWGVPQGSAPFRDWCDCCCDKSYTTGAGSPRTLGGVSRKSSKVITLC